MSDEIYADGKTVDEIVLEREQHGGKSLEQVAAEHGRNKVVEDAAARLEEVYGDQEDTVDEVTKQQAELEAAATTEPTKAEQEGIQSAYGEEMQRPVHKLSEGAREAMNLPDEAMSPQHRQEQEKFLEGIYGKEPSGSTTGELTPEAKAAQSAEQRKIDSVYG